MHLDAPDLGLFGSSPFGGGLTVTDAIQEADAHDAQFHASKTQAAPLPMVAGAGGGEGRMSPIPEFSMSAQPTTSFPSAGGGGGGPVTPSDGSNIVRPSTLGPAATLGPAPGLTFAPEGGRPPGYAVPGQAQPGSASKAAVSLLACVAAAAASGFYFQSPKGAAAGFLATGAAFNLYQAKADAGSSNPAAKTDGIWAAAASLIGLGLAGYLGYSVYQERFGK